MSNDGGATPLARVGSDHVMLVVLQHGSHGHASDFDVIRRHVEHICASSTALPTKLEFWSTPINEGLATDSGLVSCGNRLASELGKGLQSIAGRFPSATLHLSCISHSFGGLLIRYALAELDQATALNEWKLDTFISLASPHVGAQQMNLFLRLGARGLGSTLSTAYQDLMLDSTALDDLCITGACAPLVRFRHRLLYVCAWKDFLVKFETGGLIVVDGDLDAESLPAPVVGHAHVREALCLEPFLSDGSGTRELQLASGGRSQLSEVLNLQQCAKAFAGIDDRNGVRAERTVQMLKSLRSVGVWFLHIVNFPEVFVRNGHGAIICHPERTKNISGAGGDVVEHVAKILLQNACDASSLADG